MKKLIISTFAIVILLSITACGTKVEDNYSFSGLVKSINGSTATVEPNEDETIIRASGDAVNINFSDYSVILKVGDKITVYYDGVIMESYPLQINILGINDEMFDDID